MIVRKAKTRVLPILHTVFSELASDDHKYETVESGTSFDDESASKESINPEQIIPFRPYQNPLKEANTVLQTSKKRRMSTVEEPEPQNTALKFLMKQLQIAKKANMPCSAKKIDPLRRTLQRRSLSEEPVFLIQKKKCLSRKDSRKRIIWDILIVVMVLWNVIIIPLNLCYEFHSVFIMLANCLADSLFLVDLILNFRTTYLDEEGEQVTDLRHIAQRYILKGTFFIDFVAALPVEMIPRISYFKLIGLLKITRLNRLPNIIGRLNFTLLTRTILRICSLIVFLIIIYHLASCFWIYVVIHENQNWIPPVNWINYHAFNFFAISESEQYLVALYSSQLALNSGEIGPRTTVESIAGSILIFLGMFVNALMFGTMSELLFSLRKIQRENQLLIDSANTIMGKIQLPHQDRRKIIMYLSSIKVTHQTQIQLSRFQNQIPPTLRNQVRRHIYTQMLHKSELLQSVILEDNSEQTVNYLVSQFETVLSEPEDTLITYGGESEEMYFVAQGSARVLWKDLSEQAFKKLTILKEGAHFGEIGLIYNCKRTMTVETYKYSLFARLSRQNFNTLTYRYEDIFKTGIRDYQDKYKKSIETVLYRLPLFRGLSADEISRIVFAFQNKAIPNQSFAFKEEDKQEGLYLIQSGFMLLSINLQGVNVPLKSLKKGHVIGYDQIFQPSVHRVNGQCLNYTLVGDSKRRDTCFVEMPKKINKRRNAISKPVIKFTQFDDDNPPSTRRQLLPNLMARKPTKNVAKSEVQFKDKLQGLGLTPRKPKEDLQVLHPTLHIDKTGKREKTIHLSAVVSFLSNDKLKGEFKLSLEFVEEMPVLSYNYAQEMRRINQSTIRPYPLDYFIPKRNDASQGRRDAWFKVQNAIIHTILRRRQERKTMSLFDRVYEVVTKERTFERSEATFQKINKAETRLINNKNSFSMMRQKTQSTKVANQFQGYLGDIEKIVVKQQKNVERIMKRLNFLEYISTEENAGGIVGFYQHLQPRTPKFMLSHSSSHTFSEMLEGLDRSNADSSFQIPLGSEHDIEDIIAAYDRLMEQKKY